MNIMQTYSIPSPLGYWIVQSTELGLLCVDLLPETDASEIDNDSKYLKNEELERRFDAYFRGKANAFSGVPIDWAALPGTAFQKKVWQALLEIPAGEVRTYKWVCERIGTPRAYQAVGQALGRNPLPVVLPCHRIVASDGGLGGFMLGAEGGIAMKRFLLQLEGVN